MQTRRRWRRRGLGAGPAWLVLLLFLQPGCADGKFTLLPDTPASETLPENEKSPLTEADTAFTAAPVAVEEEPLATPAPIHRPTSYHLAVLHVQVPESDQARALPLWDHVREDVLDGDSQLQMHRNGFRVGIGHSRFWGAIKAILDGLPGARVTLAQPLQVPAGFPITLELDTAPRDQTLFFVSRDGVLSGDTWLSSRNVIRVSCAADPRHPGNTRMWLTPESNHDLNDWKVVKTEAGVWQAPKVGRTVFEAAALALTLGPEEFVVLAAGENSRVRGLIGSAFLTADVEGVRYRSYVFLQPNASELGAGLTDRQE